MSDQELIDGLVATYRTLNMSVRQLPEEQLQGSRDAIRRLRDDELSFSQALKMRIASNHPLPEKLTEEHAVIGTESDDDTTPALIAQFGTARESTLAMLRGLSDSEWDSTAAGARTIRMSIRDRLAEDQRHLQAISAPLGVR